MTKTPTTNYSLKDASTWVNILSVAWAVLSVVHPGFHLAAAIAPASIVAAAVVTAVVAFAKHHLSLLKVGEDLIASIEKAFHHTPPAPAPTPAPAKAAAKKR